ncbi:hypothetical protein LFWB_1170 [Candidatus Phytoplasma luffae]|uniref:Uncharacterized protein n=1 Tax=Loofah witches'-broom phytoplasma TaxID=35773 RepID=A0A975FJ80_LOWBP|nr:hypothetical protein [Candidatus Phytoplasma luffae]QTX02687.1 hypothetical protein LFWB_1170 [Candidatus Phytoplasma luffae]
MDGLIYIKFLEALEKFKINDSQNISINYKNKCNIFTLSIELLSSLSSVIFLIYIFNSLKQDMKSLNF